MDIGGRRSKFVDLRLNGQNLGKQHCLYSVFYPPLLSSILDVLAGMGHGATLDSKGVAAFKTFFIMTRFV